jgi:hypothetical protein
MNLITMCTDYEAMHGFGQRCRCTINYVKWRKWYLGERGRIMRRFNNGFTVTQLSHFFDRSERDIEDAIRYMTRKGKAK